MNENRCIFFNLISLKEIPNGSINNKPGLSQIMAWYRTDDKPGQMRTLFINICLYTSFSCSICCPSDWLTRPVFHSKHSGFLNVCLKYTLCHLGILVQKDPVRHKPTVKISAHVSLIKPVETCFVNSPANLVKWNVFQICSSHGLAFI